jgi:hypothetical protein
MDDAKCVLREGQDVNQWRIIMNTLIKSRDLLKAWDVLAI